MINGMVWLSWVSAGPWALGHPDDRPAGRHSLQTRAYRYADRADHANRGTTDDRQKASAGCLAADSS